MSDLQDIFKGKKITQMGLGLLGRGVGDACFLAEHGAELIVTDLKNEEALHDSLEKLTDYKNITFHLDGHEEGDFKDKELVLKGAGVPLQNIYIDTARKHDVPVDMSASLFARIAQIPMVGVTGTRGKSTVTELIYKILTASGYSTILGGNIKGVSNLQLLSEVKADSMGVFELDSWQCQGFAEEKSLIHSQVMQGPHSPSVAVFTTFMADHMNYYGGDMDVYLKDKTNIFKYQESGDILVIGRQALSALEPYKKLMRADVIVADETDMPKGWETKLPGKHNRYNIGVAVATARALGVDEVLIQDVVENFDSISGRLEYVASVRGVKVYNDTNATTPDAAVCALETLSTDDGQGLILIAGGAHKGLKQAAFAEAIETYATHTILLPGEGTDTINEILKSDEHITRVDSLEQAVVCAFDRAQEGDTIVLSPGCSSFGLFKNEYDRGEQFTSLIKQYEK